MIKKITFFLVGCLCIWNANAQQKSTKHVYFKRTTTETGITIATDGKQILDAIQLQQYWGLGRSNKKFKLGLGLRLTNSFGGNGANYLTAPAKLTSGKTDPSVLFADQIVSNLDTLSIPSHNVNALNLSLALHYDFSKKWGAEFNIDLAGFSFGSKENFLFVEGDKTSNLFAGYGKPTSGNFLLVSDNDIGTLNSELMCFYKYKPRLKLKAGVSFLFKEYTLHHKVKSPSSMAEANDRFRNKSLSFGLGLNYTINKSIKK
jgi:hypothetical protein